MLNFTLSLLFNLSYLIFDEFLKVLSCGSWTSLSHSWMFVDCIAPPLKSCLQFNRREECPLWVRTLHFLDVDANKLGRILTMTKKSPKNCLLQLLYRKYCYSNLLASSCPELDASVKKGRWLPNEKKLCQKFLFDFFGKLLFRWDVGLTFLSVLLRLCSLRLIIQ